MTEVYCFDTGGTMTGLYSDRNADLGKQHIRRASNVEPDQNGKWYVELSNDPLNGVHAGKLIGSGFATREAALEFEVEWINKNILAQL
jgi:hypothetical protein